MEDVDGAPSPHVVALSGGADDATQVGDGFQKRLVDRAEHGRLVRVLRLAGIQCRGLIVDQDVQRLVLGQLGALCERGGVARRRDGRREQRHRDGAQQPGAWDHTSIISGWRDHPHE